MSIRKSFYPLTLSAKSHLPTLSVPFHPSAPSVLLGLVTLSILFLIPVLPASGASAQEFAFVTTTDYESGSSAVIDLDGSYGVTLDAASIHSDAVSRYYQGLIYVVNRLNGDNIQVLDPENGFSTIRQFSSGNGSNPKDIAFFTPFKAFITRYESNDLWIVNPSTGDHTGTIDLSQFADADGFCEMDMMIVVEENLFVSIQRVDRDNWWGPVGDSYLAVIDCAADTLIDADPTTPGTQGIHLRGCNPYSGIKHDMSSGKIYISCVGWFGVHDGGIEAVNPYTLQSEGMIFNESDAGGDILDFEFYDSQTGYAIIMNASFYTDCISFDRTTGLATSIIYAPGDYVINDIEISSGGELLLSDQTATAPGVRIYDGATGVAVVPGPLSTGLPPFDICICAPVPSAAELPLSAHLGRNYPNPFNPSTTIPFSLDAPARVEISIYDAAGRRIKSILNGEMAAGFHREIWTGIDESSRPVSSGVYFAVMRAGGSSSSIKLLLLR